MPTLRLIPTLIFFTILLTACVTRPPEPGIGGEIDWDDLPGWGDDRHAEAWAALRRGCAKMPARDDRWIPVCNTVSTTGPVDDAAARRLFEQLFVPHRVNPSGDAGKGLVTGYYEPLLHGSLRPDARFRYPLYGPPPDLLRIELGELYPELKNRKLRGRLVGNKVLPYYARADIDDANAPLTGHELLWVDDPVALFFLHVQGSGRVRLTDDRYVAVGYADQNGQPYTSIGKLLIERGAIPREEISLFTIRDWLRGNPEQAAALLAENRSYIFFRLRESSDENPVGSLNVPLTPGRSIAVDPTTIPLGSPVWLDTTYPGKDGAALRRLVLAQDTGGAIKGYARADLFWGNGDEAERLAGEMKQDASLYVLLPRIR